MTACNLCSAAPHVGWFQTVPRPGTAGRENSHSDFLTQHKAPAGRAGGSRANIPSGRGGLPQTAPRDGSIPGRGEVTSDGAERHTGLSRLSALHTLPSTRQTFPPLRTGMTRRAQRTQAGHHGADHGIPGAETPPGSHSPRGRGRGRGGFWLHLLCVPAALPASVLKRSQSERGPKGRGCFGHSGAILPQQPGGLLAQVAPGLPGCHGRQRWPRSC